MFGKRDKVKHLLNCGLQTELLTERETLRFISKVLLRVIVHLWVKHDVSSISCFFCKKKLMQCGSDSVEPILLPRFFILCDMGPFGTGIHH